MEIPCAENAHFPLGSIFGDNYTACFKDGPGHLCKRWLEENEMGSLFYSLREIGTSNLIPAPIQGDSISPFHDGI